MGGPTGQSEHDTTIAPKADDVAPASGAPGAGIAAIKAIAGTGSLTPPQATAIVDQYPSDANAIFQYLQQTPQFGNGFVRQMIDGGGVMYADSVVPKDKPQHPTAHGNKPVDEYVVKPEKPVAFDPLKGAERLDHTPLSAMQPTLPDEAHVLNAVRAGAHRFDAGVLAQAQTKLGITPTGAFNTDTLRTLRHVTQKPQLGASEILSEDLWKPYHDGTTEMFMPAVDAVPGKVDGEDHESYADHCAQYLATRTTTTTSRRSWRSRFLASPRPTAPRIRTSSSD